MTKDLFANPFTITNNDQRQLNQFFDDDDDNDGGYEQVDAHDNTDHHNNDTVVVTHHNDNAEDVERGGDYYDDDNDDDHDEHEDYPNNRRRRRGDGTIGNLMPNMFSTNHSSSVNVVWLSVLLTLLFVLVAYYGLSKQQSDRLKQVEAQHEHLVGANANAVGGSFEGDEDVLGISGNAAVPINNDEDDITMGGSDDGNFGEEVGPALTYEQATSPKFFTSTLDSPLQSTHQIFDPFQLQEQKPTKIKDANDWLGAPFVVSPPQLPIVNDDDDDDANSNDDIMMMDHGRLGYFQHPTIVNGTIVFSTEGDLYLTRLPTPAVDNMAPMTAMKLTTTIGNAIHPKLNPKHAHLLAYSATYSGTREVYLMDLTPTSPQHHHQQQRGGAPGTPGGPALRLTYTPGGILSVVGWDADGTSILYSARSRDVRSLPDVRLFRLRLSWGGGDVSDENEKKDENDESAQKKVEKKSAKKSREKTVEGKEQQKKDAAGAGVAKAKKDVNDDITSEKQESKNDDEDDDDDDDYTIDQAKKYVDQLTVPNDKPPVKVVVEASQSKEGNDSGSSSSNSHEKKTKKASQKKDKDDSNSAHQRKLEMQRRHLAKLSSRRRSLKEESSIHPIIKPVPLAQATEGVYYTPSSSSDECIYFTRFKQSSNTKRYVGGTAESLWAYCPNNNDDLAIPLTGDYNGTSKSPSVYYTHGDDEDDNDVLFFMSDRSPVVQQGGSKKSNAAAATEWVASSMDLWAAPLPISLGPLNPIRLTNVACQYNGLDLSEYAIDPSSGGVILRVGADLHFMSLESIKEKLYPSLSTKEESNPPFSTAQQPLPIAVYSDFSNMQERIIPIQIPKHITTLDAYSTSYGTVSTLLTARGQTFVAPVIEDTKSIPQTVYGGGGRNMPARRYKVAPGTGGGGLVRILSAKHVPKPSVTSAPIDSGERLALILATDPLSPTGEHAFYLIRTDAMASPAFGFAALYEYGDVVADTGLPAPFIGGHLESGGSTKEGGLGSVYADSIKMSPCGRRFAFTDTDGRIVVVTTPTLLIKTEGGRSLEEVDIQVLPSENEVGQPIVGKSETSLVWSPGGKYLAIEHSAKNQFKVISVADIGSPEDGIKIGRIVQATPDRFNSFSPVWGHASKDFVIDLYDSALNPAKSSSSGGATALIFLSDRDVKLAGKTSPWGTRAPSPSFDGHSCVHVLPLQSMEDALVQSAINKYIQAPYGGGGAAEVAMEGLQELSFLLDAMQGQALVATGGDASPTKDDVQTNATEQTDESNSTAAGDISQPFVIDTPISFGKENDQDFSFARSSYRIDHIPAADYAEIVCQLADDPSLLLLTQLPAGGFGLTLFAIVDWPSDATEEVPAPAEHVLQDVEVSSDGQFILTIQNGKLKVIPRKVKDALAFFTDTELERSIADIGGLHLSVWPNLEFQQMYSDSWRMLRDYFYDANMHSINWETMFERYLPLVERCSKREELDDVLRQMIGELSALHSFVYGGEYSSPHHDDKVLESINDVASLGAILQRSVEKRGYLVVDVPQRDPDLHMLDGVPMYSPLSNLALNLSGQAGVEPGDVIVAVNGENVMDVPDIHMLLRNTAGESVRLDVLRMESTSKFRELHKLKGRLLQNDAPVENEGISPEPLIVVPITSEDSGDLAYAAWEWKTRERAKALAAHAGFTCGYTHVQSMSGASAMDSFVRGFYPDYDKDALIIDVRNNRGGNIDSWLLDTLQRRAWMYWESRSSNITTGGLGWDMQFAFRGHLIVLINEHTSSDGEAFARGVSELGLGKLVGKRTWGGGIWLSSDNHLVDGGIASAPEVGTYNDNLGWGLGIEQMGVMPDIEVDNNPKSAYDGEDAQLEHAISELKEWLEQEPVALPKNPGPRKDMSKKESGCSA